MPTVSTLYRRLRASLPPFGLEFGRIGGAIFDGRSLMIVFALGKTRHGTCSLVNKFDVLPISSLFVVY